MLISFGMTIDGTSANRLLPACAHYMPVGNFPIRNQKLVAFMNLFGQLSRQWLRRSKSFITFPEILVSPGET